MSHYHSYGDDDSSWGEIIMIFVLAIALVWAVNACQAGDREKCERNGGVWLVRESACVAGPGGK